MYSLPLMRIYPSDVSQTDTSIRTSNVQALPPSRVPKLLKARHLDTRSSDWHLQRKGQSDCCCFSKDVGCNNLNRFKFLRLGSSNLAISTSEYRSPTIRTVTVSLPFLSLRHVYVPIASPSHYRAGWSDLFFHLAHELCPSAPRSFETRRHVHLALPILASSYQPQPLQRLALAICPTTRGFWITSQPWHVPWNVRAMKAMFKMARAWTAVPREVVGLLY
jgi:hypothetical protein